VSRCSAEFVSLSLQQRPAQLTLRTITNWVREFEKWVPHMRVVPYYGEASCKLPRPRLVDRACS
jgi:SNF2 family DNA or RNA helicase